MRTLLLFIHILAVASWLGANVTQFVVTPSMHKTGGAPAAAWMRQTVRLGTRIYTPAAVTILITGFWMVLRESAYDFEQAFVVIGMVTVIVGAVLGIRVFGPGGREAAEMYDSGDASKVDEKYRRLAMFALIDTALVVFTIWAMIERLGL